MSCSQQYLDRREGYNYVWQYGFLGLTEKTSSFAGGVRGESSENV